jgi:hypothetical protein
MTATHEKPAPARTLEIRPAPSAEPAAELTCPCPLRGLRCGDCVMIAFAPPPFTATRLGWTLATLRRIGWRIRGIFTRDA